MLLTDETKMENLIKLQEGLKLQLYKDIMGNQTIGYGRNLSAKGIRTDEAALMFANDIAEVEADLKRTIPWYEELSPARQAVIIDVCFNIGLGGLMGFKDFLRAAESGDAKTAATELLDSHAAKQLPNRYQRLAYIYESDSL